MGEQLQGEINLGSSNLNTDAVHFVSGMAGAIAGAGARTLINGTDFGDNIMRALPRVIGQTVGNAMAGGDLWNAFTQNDAPSAGAGGGQTSTSTDGNGDTVTVTATPPDGSQVPIYPGAIPVSSDPNQSFDPSLLNNNMPNLSYPSDGPVGTPIPRPDQITDTVPANTAPNEWQDSNGAWNYSNADGTIVQYHPDMYASNGGWGAPIETVLVTASQIQDNSVNSTYVGGTLHLQLLPSFAFTASVGEIADSTGASRGYLTLGVGRGSAPMNAWTHGLTKGIYLGYDAGKFSGSASDFGGPFYTINSSVGPVSAEAFEGLSTDQTQAVIGVGGGAGIGAGATSFAGGTNTFLTPEISDGAKVMFPFLMAPMIVNSLTNSAVAEFKYLTK